MAKKIVLILFPAVILGSVIFLKDQPIYFNKLRGLFQNQPCSQPITYSLGSVDSRFGLSRTDLLSDVNQAQAVWDKAAGKTLFVYSPAGALKINLVYDYREEDMKAIKTLGLSIQSTKSSYDALKSEYDSLFALYNQKKAALDLAEAQYTSKEQAYEAAVRYWNSRGGAPQDQYATLAGERTALMSQAAEINSQVADLNNLSDKINALVDVLNHLAQELDLNVATYNNVNSQTGRSFTEGDYKQNGQAEDINVYEFDGQNQLIRVLTHEFGHALGMNHVTDPKAIMYKFNEGANDVPTAADIKELDRVCGL